MSDLTKKVNQAIKLLRLADAKASGQASTITFDGGGQAVNNQQVEISYSGGKDSDVILHLAKMAGINHKAIYKATTIDPSGTIAHARANNAAVIFPEKTFFQLIQTSGFPTRRARFCCEKLKEYKVNDVAVQGIRKCESRARMERYEEPTICRIYGSKKNHVNVFLPILEWTDEDVKEFVEQEKIQCHPLYYDEQGHFHPERRLGCMCCPLMSTKRCRAEFKANPGFVKAWIRNGKIWWENRPNTRSHEIYGTIYNLFFYNVFCNNMNDYYRKTTGLFGNLDCKAYMEDYFKIDLP